jgi:hypothetical protein
MKKILKIFKVDTVSRLIIIFTVFGITGSLSVVVGDYLFNLFFPFSEGLLYWILRILIIFPAYQILLIIVGSIFGEFKYFWEMEKKILKRLKILKSSSS